MDGGQWMVSLASLSPLSRIFPCGFETHFFVFFYLLHILSNLKKLGGYTDEIASADNKGKSEKGSEIGSGGDSEFRGN